MSRRYSTIEYSVNDQKDMTNDVRLKLAKVRARSRSICEPPPPLANNTLSSSAGAELKKSKRSSQIPRSSITAMTTSAKAKVRSPYTNDCPTKNNNKARYYLVSSPPPSPTNILEPNNNNRRRHSTTSNNHQGTTKSTATARWNEDDTLIKFFDSDSDEDELFLRNNNKKKKTKLSPPLERHHEQHQEHVTSTLPAPTFVDNADENHDQSLWAELQELKSRLAKLEVMQTPASNNNNKKTGSGTSRRSSLNSSLLLSPQSSLVDSACSVYNNKNHQVPPSHSQKALQDTVLHLEQNLRQQQDDDRSLHSNSKDTTTTFMDTLVALVAETMTINQTLASWGSRQQQQQISSNDLLTIQKSSDHQIKLLTETLQTLATQHQPQTMDPLVSPPLSDSGSINSDTEAIHSPKPSKHRVVFSSPTGSPQQKKTSTQQLYTPNTSQSHQRSLSSTDQKRQSTNIIRFKDHHEVTPTRQQHQTKSVNGILYYPHRQQQEQNTKSTTTSRQQQDAFYPMSSSRVNHLLSKCESLLLKPTTTRTKFAAARQPHVDRDRFPSLIDC